MLGCNDCQDRMLEHLYDLLEGDEQRTFLDHLAGCPACQGALEKARAHQQRLASAARASFPEVRFTAPVEQLTLVPAEVVPFPAPAKAKRPARSWPRWAAAAAVLIALAGLAVPADRARRDNAQARAALRTHDDAVAAARDQANESRNEMRLAALERDQKVAALDQERKARGLRLVVTGARHVQSGAPADFQVQAEDFNGNPADIELIARITDETSPADLTFSNDKDKTARPDTFLLTGTKVKAGVYSLRVPPTVKRAPGKELRMQVAARRLDDKADREPVALHGTVRLSDPVFLTHLTTDKPMYQPGETLRFRSLTLDRLTLTPPKAEEGPSATQNDFRLRYKLVQPSGAEQLVLRGASSLMSERGKEVALVNGPDGKTLRGIGAGEVLIPADAPGGEYTLTVLEEQNRFAPVSRKFLVNRYQKPRLDKKLDFNRSTYGVGDEVQVRASAKRADGGAVKSRPVEASVTIDGNSYDRDGRPTGAAIKSTTDDNGEVVLKFKLPSVIERGQASLGITFLDGGAVETIVRPIPIVLKKLNVEFFPEGGDLVAGLENRVYFQARTPLGKPAQMTGSILEDGKPIAGVKVATLHDDRHPGVNQGTGAFSFTPRTGKKYELRIESPAGVTGTKALPKMRDEGVVMRVEKGMVEPGDTIRVRVNSTKARAFLVGAYCRGQVLASAQLGRGQTEAELRPTSGTGGVVRITVFEELPAAKGQRALRPVAERLIYRAPRERVDIALSSDQRRYTPGDKVNLSVLAVDEKEKWAPAIVLLSVVDKSVLTMADEKTARTLPTHYLLTTEVRRADDLEHADFLVGGHPKASQALDLLLGTQGWRRFAEQSPADFRDRLLRERKELPLAEQQRQEVDAERLLVLIGQSNALSTDLDKANYDRVMLAYEAKRERLQDDVRQSQAVIAEAKDDPEYSAAVVTLARHDRWWRLFRTRMLPAFGAVLVLLGLVGLLVSAARANGLREPGKVAGLVTVGAFGVLLVAFGAFGPGGLVATDSQRRSEVAMMEATAAQNEEKAMPRRGLDRADLEVLDPEQAAVGAGEGKGLGGGGLAPAPGVVPPMAPRPDRGFGADPRFRMQPRPGPAAGPMLPKGGEMAGGIALKDALRPLDRDDREQGKREPAEGADGRANPEFARRLQMAAQLQRFAPNAGADGPRALGKAKMGKGGGFRGGAGGRSAYYYEPPMLVREFAHVHKPAGDGLRSDFTETVYWHPVLVLPESGKAEVSFSLSESVTSFQVTAFAHTLDGRLGAATKVIESRLPLTLAPRVPLEVTSTDIIDLPVVVTNNTSEKRSLQLALTNSDGLELLGGSRDLNFDLFGEGQTRRLYRFRPTLVQGTAKVELAGRTGPFKDAIRETIKVVPDGFPVGGASSDVLEKSATHKLTLPRWMPGTLSVKVDVYPSTLADLQKGLEGLVREPYGCFEQSSSSNYPNVLILDYLQTSDKASPEVEKRVREVLGRGYSKLVGFECQVSGKPTKRGYEWFGGTAPPHEALTAYGLLQFHDMARVHDVNKDMVERTRKYLLDQRDGNGGFKRNPQALDTFGRAPDHVTNAYIVWALTEAGKDDVTKELDALAKKAKESKDPYFLSLVALGMINRDRRDEATALMKTVAGMQKDDGRLESTDTSITGSGGRDLAIETTALAMLAWLKIDALANDAPLRKAVKWVGQQRGGYGAFGSTQATILALKALIAHAKANKRTVSGGELRLFVGEKQVAEVSFPAGHDKPLTLEVPDAEKLLKAGQNKLRVEITGEKNTFPHTLSWSARTTQPNSAKGAPVELATTLAKTEVKEGEATRLTVKVKNVSGKPQGMAVAIVGLPAGMNLPEDLKQLKEHCKLPEDGTRPLVSFFEVRGRELVLYWRDMGKDQEISVPVDVIARVPGTYRGPASRAYLYYNADLKHWVTPLSAAITARE